MACGRAWASSGKTSARHRVCPGEGTPGPAVAVGGATGALREASLAHGGTCGAGGATGAAGAAAVRAVEAAGQPL